jgi:hypothetical protein
MPEVPASKRSHRTRISRRMLFIFSVFVVSVALLDGLGHHHHQLGCLARREGPFIPAMRQALPLEEAHRQIAPAIVLTDLVDRTMPEWSSFAAATA